MIIVIQGRGRKWRMGSTSAAAILQEPTASESQTSRETGVKLFPTGSELQRTNIMCSLKCVCELNIPNLNFYSCKIHR
jgi:hypothetical protein